MVLFICHFVQCRVCEHFKLFNGLHKFSFNGHGSDLAIVKLNSKVLNAVGCIKAILTSGGGDLGSYPNSPYVVTNGVQKHDVVAFGTIGADTAVPAGSGFSDDDDEYDFDSPTEGFASISEAIEDIKNGKVVTFSLLGFSLFLFSAVKVYGMNGFGFVFMN